MRLEVESDPSKFDRKLVVGVSREELSLLPCYSSKGVDEAWLKQAVYGLQARLPDTLLYLLGTTGQRVFFVDSPEDVGMKSRTPDPTDHYKRAPAEVGGLYQPGNTIMVSRTSFRLKQGKHILNGNLEQVTVHEVMHSLDNSFLKIVDKPEFLRAYRLDVLAFGKNKLSYGYQRQKGRRGPEEALAEIGSQIYTGSCRAGDMEKDWPHSYQWAKIYFGFVEKGFDPRTPRDMWRQLSKNAAKSAELTLIQGLLISDTGFRQLADQYTGMRNDNFDALARGMGKTDKRYMIWKEMLFNQDKKSIHALLRNSPRSVATP